MTLLLPVDPTAPPVSAKSSAPSAKGLGFILAPVFAIMGAASSGCYRVPAGRAAVSSVSLQGNHKLSEAEVLEKIATTPSPKFLGIKSGFIYEYELYDRFSFQRDLARVERYYRSRGYYEAQARAGRVELVAPNKVAVTVVVEEGQPVLIRSATVRGIDHLSPAIEQAALEAVDSVLVKGEPLDEEVFNRAEDTLTRSLTDRGYAYAKTSRIARVDLPTHTAEALFDVEPGEPAVFGEVRLEGLGNLPEAPVRRALHLKPGTPYSSLDLQNAQQAVLDLGIFSSADIVPQFTDPPAADHVVPLVVKLQPTALHSIQLGIGTELDIVKFDLHGVVQYEDKNFLGGLRNFRLTDKPGVVFYPTNISYLKPPQEWKDLLPENRLRADLRQPGLFEPRTTGIVRAEYNIYPLLLTGAQSGQPSVPVIGYQEVIGSVGLERTIWKLLLNPSYNLQSNFPFAYIPPLDPTLHPVIVSYLDMRMNVDFRDDRMHPTKGTFSTIDVQYAGGFLGGTADDVRVQPDLRGYIPISPGITLAVRGSVGFVFPRNYGDTYTKYAPSGPANPGKEPSADDKSPAGQAAHAAWKAAEDKYNAAEGPYTKDLQILFFRGFYSGGTTGNRGYALRGVGPQGNVPFFNPAVATSQFANECPVGSTDPRCLYPLGGLSLWEASVEVRFHIAGPLSVATFCDASDVSPQKVDIRLNRPHLSCGAGPRYDTPVGPIRLDIGYRIPGAQTIGPKSSVGETTPQEIFGFFPGAVAFGIGESF